MPIHWGRFIFRNHYTNSPYTYGAFPSIFTSTYPYMSFSKRTIKNRCSFVEIIKKFGFRTIGYNGSNPWLSKEFGYNKGFEYFFKGPTSYSTHVGLKTYIKKLLKTFNSNIEKHNYLLSMLLESWIHSTSVALDTIKHIERKKNICNDTDRKIYSIITQWTKENQNIFLWYHLMDPHYPYTSPLIKDFIEYIRTLYGIINYEYLGQIVNKDLIKNVRKYYDLSSTYAIFKLKAITDFLDSANMLKDYDKYILITSDHGEEFFEHKGLFHEGTVTPYYSYPHLFNENLHVPLILASPSFTNKSFNDPTSHVQITPTVIDLALNDISKETAFTKSFIKILKSIFLGKSLTMYFESEFNHVIKTNKNKIVQPIFSEAETIIYKPLRLEKVLCCKYAIITSNYKYIYDPSYGELLYNIKLDPHEKNTIFDKSLTLKFRRLLVYYLRKKSKFEARYRIYSKLLRKITK